jgi:hypothetical protein
VRFATKLTSPAREPPPWPPRSPHGHRLRRRDGQESRTDPPRMCLSRPTCVHPTFKFLLLRGCNL